MALDNNEYSILYIDPVQNEPLRMNPAPIADWSVLNIGKRDVPAGVPFWIVKNDTIPNDVPIAALHIDEEHLGQPDGFGGTYVPPVITRH